MQFRTSSLYGRNMADYSIYRNMNVQAGLYNEPAGSPAENRKVSDPGNIQKNNEVTGCQTCRNRKYVDRSNDPGVSFKSPTNVSPGASFSAVTAHEQQHVSREQAKALRNDRKVVSQSVQIYYDICPECGRVYTSGGKTTTVTRGESKKPDYFLEKMNKFFDGQFGKKIDIYI